MQGGVRMRTVGFWRWERAFHRGRRGGGAGLSAICLLLLCAGALLLMFKSNVRAGAGDAWEREAALFLWKTWYGSPQSGDGTDEEFSGWLARFILKQVPYYRNAEGKQDAGLPGEIDPSYRGYLESAALLKEYEYLVRDLEGSALLADEGAGEGREAGTGAGNGVLLAENSPAGESDPAYRAAGAAGREGTSGAENAAGSPGAKENEPGAAKESAADRGAADQAGTQSAGESAARAAGGTVAGKELFQSQGAI